MVGCGWISNRHITPQLYLPWGALAGRSPSGGYTGVATADPVPGTCNIEVIYQLSALVFNMGQPAGVHAPTWTLTHQNPYPPTKGTGCSHGSKGLNLQWVNPRLVICVGAGHPPWVMGVGACGCGCGLASPNPPTHRKPRHPCVCGIPNFAYPVC